MKNFDPINSKIIILKNVKIIYESIGNKTIDFLNKSEHVLDNLSKTLDVGIKVNEKTKKLGLNNLPKNIKKTFDSGVKYLNDRREKRKQREQQEQQQKKNQNLNIYKPIVYTSAGLGLGLLAYHLYNKSKENIENEENKDYKKNMMNNNQVFTQYNHNKHNNHHL